MADVSFNGQTAQAMYWYVDSLDEWFNVAETVRATTPPAVGLAGVQLTGFNTMGARTVTLRGRIVTPANTVADRIAAENAWRDLFANRGLVEMVVNDGVSPLRAAWVYAQRVRIRPLDHPLLARVSEMEVTLVAPDALWRAPMGSVLALPTAGVDTPIPLGTAPTWPIIRVMGSATTPAVTVKDSAGITKLALSLATLAAGTWVDLDLGRMVYTQYASGTPSTASVTVTTGALPCALDPAWGDYPNSVWPTVAVSAGTGEVLYIKRYW